MNQINFRMISNYFLLFILIVVPISSCAKEFEEPIDLGKIVFQKIKNNNLDIDNLVLSVDSIERQKSNLPKMIDNKIIDNNTKQEILAGISEYKIFWTKARPRMISKLKKRIKKLHNDAINKGVDWNNTKFRNIKIISTDFEEGVGTERKEIEIEFIHNGKILSIPADIMKLAGIWVVSKLGYSIKSNFSKI